MSQPRCESPSCKTKRFARFKVQHPETSPHWRCLECMRDIGPPYLVIGHATPGSQVEMEYRTAMPYKLAITAVWQAGKHPLIQLPRKYDD